VDIRGERYPKRYEQFFGFTYPEKGDWLSEAELEVLADKRLKKTSQKIGKT